MKLTTHTHTHTHITLQLSAPTSQHSEPWHFALDTLPERDISFLFCFSLRNFHHPERLLLLLYLYLTWWPFSAAKKNSPNYILPFTLLCNPAPTNVPAVKWLQWCQQPYYIMANICYDILKGFLGVLGGGGSRTWKSKYVSGLKSQNQLPRSHNLVRSYCTKWFKHYTNFGKNHF